MPADLGTQAATGTGDFADASPAPLIAPAPPQGRRDANCDAGIACVLAVKNT
jgi:hypothetical protein